MVVPSSAVGEAGAIALHAAGAESQKPSPRKVYPPPPPFFFPSDGGSQVQFSIFRSISGIPARYRIRAPLLLLLQMLLLYGCVLHRKFLLLLMWFWSEKSL